MEVVFYTTSRGDKPVEDFFDSLDEDTQAKLPHKLELLALMGNKLGMPHSKSLGGSLFELRIRGKVDVRVIYTFKDKQIILLHAFRKTSQSTPAKELSISHDRLYEIFIRKRKNR